MALPAKPSLQEIHDEFHPLYVVNSLRWQWEAIFGTPSFGVGASMYDFAGYGKPVVIRTGDSSDTDSITVNINVTTNGTTTYVRLQANPASDPSITETGDWVSKSNGSTTVTLSGLDDQTEYSYRIQYYNSFGTSTYYEQSSAYTEITDQATLVAPSLNSISLSGISFTIGWGMTPPVADSLSIEYQINGGTWLTNDVTVTNFNNSSLPYSVTFWTNNLPTTSGHVYNFRAKAVKSGYNTSVYSNTISKTVP